MTARPTIGIATQTQEPFPGISAPTWIMGHRYVKVLVAEGGVPWLIPLLPGDEATLRAIYERLDGVFLTGGIDVDPGSYNETPKPNLGKTDPARDWTEIKLVEWARQDQKPVLGVCRGLQIINVALGGTLYQDLGSERASEIKHDCFPSPGVFARNTIIHEVFLEPQSRLGRLFGETRTAVNSMHHQGIKKLASDLKINATAPDGLIEGAEGTNGQFLIGVQWHPEELVDSQPQTRAMFKELVHAALDFSVPRG